MPDVVLSESRDGVAVITLNRPEARNALSREVLRRLPEALAAADADPEVGCVVLTGADPAFCAGLDLKELGSGSGGGLGASDTVGEPWPPLTKPLIGAVNGVAITGGLELALACDFLIASERARFGDTHARVGILPGWQLTVRLPQAVGLRRAIEMSMTGNFVGAEEALRLGMVNHVVPHDDLLPTTLEIARTIAANDPVACRSLLASYKRIAATTAAEGKEIEQEVARAHQGRSFDAAEVERRRMAIVERGRTQQG